MRNNRASGLVLPNLPRRRFVQGLAAGGVIAGLGLAGFTSAAPAASTALGTAPVLRGTEFDLIGKPYKRTDLAARIRPVLDGATGAG